MFLKSDRKVLFYQRFFLLLLYVEFEYSLLREDSSRWTIQTGKQGFSFRHYIGDLVNLTDTKLLKMKNFGRTSLSEIKLKLNKLNLSLGMRLYGWPPKDISALLKIHSEAIERIRKQEAEKLQNNQLTSKLEEELARLAGLAKNDRDVEIVIRYHGWDGKGGRTLESVGKDYDLTRERVRQILKKFHKQIRWRTKNKGAIFLPNLEKAIKVIKENIPNKAKIIESKIHKVNISKKIFRIEGILNATKAINRKTNFDIVKYKRIRFVTDNKMKKAPKYISEIARKSITSMGVITAQDIAAQVSDILGEEINIDFVKKILSSNKHFILLDELRNWYWHNNLARNRLLNVIKKILSVCPSIDVSELRGGIGRFHRFHGFAPPRRVLLSLCNVVPWCKVNGTIITADPPIDYEDVLESNEWALAAVLIDEGYVLDRENFRKICLDLGMNDNTFGLYLSHSPIITRFDFGVYGLRGAKINPGKIEALKSKRPIFKGQVLKDYGWTNNGKIWLGFKLSRGLLTGGVFSIPSAMRRFLEGRYKFQAIDGSDIGELTIRNNSGWNIRPFFDRRGGDIGDILILEFDLSKSIVYASLGNEDLLDEYRTIETGKI